MRDKFEENSETNHSMNCEITFYENDRLMNMSRTLLICRVNKIPSASIEVIG